MTASPDNQPSESHALSPSAKIVDKALADFDAELDWLTRFTPNNIDYVWQTFRDSNFKTAPRLAYDDTGVDLPAMRSKLFALPVQEIDEALIEALLIEKQREIDRQIELVRMRESSGVIVASMDLFGSVDETLRNTAEAILADVPDMQQHPRDSNADAFVAAATAEMSWYHEQDSNFRYAAHINPVSGSSLYTSAGDLYVAHDYRAAAARIDPLIQHEIGTHTVTRYNGEQQPLHVLSCGLPDYDALQEGIAVLGEYLAGYLPPHRLRILAGRVIAADMAVHENPVEQIFAKLHDGHGFEEMIAFDTAIRAVRGGGLTKDALYLKGLIELLSYLQQGGDFEILFLGKFALKQLPVLEKLIANGVVNPPSILPRYMQKPDMAARLEKVRNIDITEFYQESPIP